MNLIPISKNKHLEVFKVGYFDYLNKFEKFHQKTKLKLEFEKNIALMSPGYFSFMILKILV